MSNVPTMTAMYCAIVTSQQFHVTVEYVYLICQLTVTFGNMTITDVHGSSYYLTITHNTINKLHKMLNLKMTSLGSKYGKQTF